MGFIGWKKYCSTIDTLLFQQFQDYNDGSVKMILTLYKCDNT